mmetsp:Transcript_3290/g.7735  ORF Transcript_3290/g.7735 Transcript_3290/m.7735 type:complete len:180 (+) Transcript_3290:154-693(+)
MASKEMALSRKRTRQQGKMAAGGNASEPTAGSGEHDFIKVQTGLKRGRADAARPSAMVRLGAADFLERFTELFEEHIDGFTGLRGSKRPRSEKEKKMEWRVRLEAKRQGETASLGAASASKKAVTPGKKAGSKPPGAVKASSGSAKPATNKAAAQAAREAAIARYKALKKQKTAAGRAK